MPGDRLLFQKILWLKGQHCRLLDNHKETLNLMRQELQSQQKLQEARDVEGAELKDIVKYLMEQVKGKGETLDTTPEASGGDSGKGSPSR